MKATTQPNPLAKQLNEAGKLYNNNEYARGLKFVNKLLKKYPDNGELIAWKSLFLQFTKHKKEAIENINIAIRKDIRNPRVWKINGTILKEQGDYPKALQSFTQSYKMDPKDESVLFDICNLLLFERNWPSFLEHSRKFVQTSTGPNSLVRYALALHMNKRTQTAINFLNIYETNFLPPKTDDEKLFRSELYLFHATMILEIEKYEDCLTYLDRVKANILDHESVLEKQLQCYLKLNQKDKAIQTIHELINVYPENGDYFNELERLLTPEEYMNELKTIKEKNHSRYAEIRILELMNVNDPQFESLLKSYLVPYLVKGAPQIFTTLQELSPEKLEVAVKIAEDAEVPLSSVPIVHLFKANVLASNGKYVEAIEEVNKGLKHTPTCIELIATLIRFNRKIGNISASVECGKNLSEADPADRNSNILYVNALLRFGQLNTAFKTALPFSLDYKHNPKLTRTEFNDFHVRVADAAYRAKDYTTANKFYSDVIKNFEAYRKAQFNYLSWGMRHISALYKVIKWEDQLHSHPMLARASVGLLKIALLQKDLKSAQTVALKMTTATDNLALAYAAVYFALQNDYIPALKCYIKVNNSSKYICDPAIKKMMQNVSNVPELVKEVINEVYKPSDEKFENTFKNCVAAGRGNVLIGNIEEAKKLLLMAAKDFEYGYKEALDLYTVAKNEMNDDEFAEKIEKEIKSKYQSYQLKFEYEPLDEVFLVKNK